MSNNYEQRLQPLLKGDPGTVNFAYPSSSLWEEVEQKEIIDVWKGVESHAGDSLFILGFPDKGRPSDEKIPLTIYMGSEGCPTRCTFCGFGAAKVGSDATVDGSVEGILEEVTAYRDAMDWSAYEVSSVFIGGGTPNMMEADQLEQVVHALDFLPKREGYELGTEVFPQEVLQNERLRPRKTEDFLRTFRDLGGTRVNWAVQDFDEDVLRASGRRYSIAEAKKMYDLIMDLGFEHVNVDLLVGTKGHREKGIEGMIAGVQDLVENHGRPQRITPNIISLTYSGIPDSKLKLADSTLVGFDTQYAWYEAMHEVVTGLGFPQINRFDYGMPSQYELDVTDSFPRLAFGTGALGYVPSTEGGLEFKNPIVRDERKGRAFHLTPELAVARAAHNAVFNGTVNENHIANLATSARIGDFDKKWNSIIEALRCEDLVYRDAPKIVLTKRGKYHHATVQNFLGEAVLGYPNNMGKRLQQ